MRGGRFPDTVAELSKRINEVCWAIGLPSPMARLPQGLAAVLGGSTNLSANGPHAELYSNLVNTVE